MKERIISLCLLLLAGLTILALVIKLPKKEYAHPASEFSEAVRNGTTKAEQQGSSASATPAVSADVIRLHILADSDDQNAQETKLALRDVLLPYLNAATMGAETKEEAMEQLTAQCSSLTGIANSFLAEQNAGYTAAVSVEQVYFPIRIYGSQTYLSEDAVIFPPGYYDSVQVVLGRGEGHNWWCLAYPSLCFIDASYDYIPKDSDLYWLKIGTMQESALEELFYGDELPKWIKKSASEDETITVYAGSKLWEILRDLLKTED